jgi:hypothetical protein
MKSHLLKLSLASAVVVAGIAAGCSSDSSPVAGDAGSGGETSSGAGKSGGHAGAGVSAAGSPGDDAGTSTEGGAAGAPSAAAGSPDSAGSAGDAAQAGEGGEAGAVPTSGGTAGSAGSAGKGGSGGVSGGGAGGGGAGGGAGSSGSAGSAGAPPTLYIPASTTCAAGNVLAAYAVCRNCHGNPLSTTTTPPFMLVTYADVKAHAGDEFVQVNAGVMPLPVTGIAFGAAATCSTGGTKTCKNVLLDWLSAGAVGVTALNGVCP